MAGTVWAVLYAQALNIFVFSDAMTQMYTHGKKHHNLPAQTAGQGQGFQNEDWLLHGGQGCCWQPDSQGA